MTIWQGAFLGFLQGMAEFLPISSSGHLAIFEQVLGLKESNLFFNVMVHLGTLLAVIIYFRKDLIAIFIDFIVGTVELIQGNKWSDVMFRNPHFKLFLLIVVASVPTVLMGFYLRDFFEGLFGSLLAVGFALWITSIFLWLTQYMRGGSKDYREMNVWHALVIGFFQGLAIAPGISRSGATISSALYMGIDRETAARFSFIMSIPVILGASFFEFQNINLNGGELPPLSPVFAGVIMAAVIGYLAIRFLLRVLVLGNFHRFSYYTLILGAIALIGSLFTS